MYIYNINITNILLHRCADRNQIKVEIAHYLRNSDEATAGKVFKKICCTHTRIHKG